MRVASSKTALGSLCVAMLAMGAVACISGDDNAQPAVDAGSPFNPDTGARPFEAGVDANPGVDAGVGANDGDTDATVTDANGTDGEIADAPADTTPPDPCATNDAGCDPNATCSSVDGGAVCTCNAGWVPNGSTCDSACLTSNGGCDPNATCANGASGVVCACVQGFTGDGVSCASNDYTAWPAPSDAPPETAYAVSPDGVVVTDAVTGLTWQRSLFASPCPGDGAGVCTWANANAYCASLDTLGGTGLEGVTGWRVPSVVELLSIVNYADGTPAIDTAIFPGTPAAPAWAHTKKAPSTTSSWMVDFTSGLNATQVDTTASRVRCVTSNVRASTTPTCGTLGLACCYANSCGPDLACSGGTCAIASDYAQTVAASDSPLESSSVVSADGAIVTDTATGLHWQRDVFANPCPGDGAGVCTWANAQTYCATLDTADGGGLGGIATGWRLPSVVELLSIVSYTAGSPSLDTALFPATPTVAFWAQTPSSTNGANAWSVSFASGLNTTQAMATASAVRCVSNDAPSAATACGASGLACCYANSCGPDLTCNAAACAIDANYTQSIVPADTPPEGGYTVSPSGAVVTDGLTGLVWQRQVLAGPCSGSACTWAQAATYCASLDGLAVGGYASGWRLPSVTELLSIASYDASPLFISTSPFSNPPAGTFWSSTPSASAAGQAYGVSYTTGVNTLLATSSSFGVRCVSSSGLAPAPESCGTLGQTCCYAGTCAATLLCSGNACVTDTNYVLTTPAADSPTAAAYVISGDSLVATDSVTGLSWLRAAGGSTPCPGDGSGVCTFAHAATFCAGLGAFAPGGLGTGWRLPSLVELQSVVSYAASAPKVTPGVLTGVAASPYWSSTTGAGGATQAWSIDFASGLNALVSTGGAAAPLCVNGN